jgi:two-component system, chemotaxis family, chemotaxis protein CheY
MSILSILVVDDDTTMHTIYKATLDKIAVSVDFATSGETGVDKLRRKTYDVMFLDMVMENGTGLDLLATAVKEKMILPLTVVCSGVSGEEYVNAALELGAASYIIKPMQPKQIYEVVLDYMKLKENQAKRNIQIPTPEAGKLKSGIAPSMRLAMGEFIIHQATGQILVQTRSDTAVLNYEKGRLINAKYQGMSGFDALKALEQIPHMTVMIQAIEF